MTSLDDFVFSDEEVVALVNIGRSQIPKNQCLSDNPLLKPAYDSFSRQCYERGWADQTGKALFPIVGRTSLKLIGNEYYFILSGELDLSGSTSQG